MSSQASRIDPFSASLVPRRTPVTALEPVSLGPADFGSYDDAIRREWLVTNGLGGFASGTVGGANTRRYHGLLVAALNPPVQRTLLVAKLDATLEIRGQRFALGTNEYTDGTVDPRGYQYLESFDLEGTTPIWRYACADALLEQRVFMVHGQNTTVVTWTLIRAGDAVRLKLSPLCAYRDYHAHGHGGWQPGVSTIQGGVRIDAFDGAQPYRIVADLAQFHEDGDWHWGLAHQTERQRGLDDNEDLYRPGEFVGQLSPGDTLTVVLSTESVQPQPATRWLERENTRVEALLADIPDDAPGWIRRLNLAADQFIVRRAGADDEDGTTVIAGYPWFSDWGRDTMIALPGLTLATGRYDQAASILRTFARHVSEGMLPNRFPDAGEAPEYNTADATLWYFHAVREYINVTGDQTLTAELYPVLSEIADWHRRGTRYGIRVDPADGLLAAGEPGVQLTWMDAKVGDWVVTPRQGKPVEINALWHNALRVLAELADRQGDATAAAGWLTDAQRVARSFQDRYWFEEGGYLYDVIDGPEGTPDTNGRRCDARLRPNQILAVSLPFELLDTRQQRSVVDVCASELYTRVGLRSLAPGDPDYTGRYGGGPLERDGAYHQGTVWSWLAGPFAEAHFKVYRDPEVAVSFLAGVGRHLHAACLGTVSEIFDGDPPHAPRGCFAQAWGIAETLRAWHSITTTRAGIQP